MPLQLNFGHRRSKSSTAEQSPSSGQSTPFPSSPVIVVNDGPPVQGILKQHTPSIASDLTGTSTSASAYGRPDRLTSTSFARTDTTDSRWSLNGDDELNSPHSLMSPLSTPATSQSSLTGHCPLPESSPHKQFPYFAMSLSSNSTLSFIALPVAMRVHVLDALKRAWRRGIKSSGQVEYAPDLMKSHQAKGCDGGVWEVTLKDNCWVPRSEDKVSSRRIILNLMTVFAREGWELTSSFRTTAKETGKDTLMFSRCEPDPDPIFFGVGFHSSDRVWIIDAEADIGQALEDGIKASWVDGIRDARVRERHCRELRLKGSPWTAHTTSALISARCVHVVIMAVITRARANGATYKFVGSIDMCDAAESQMPFEVYRLDNRPGAGWGDPDCVPEIKPVSDAARASMNLGKMSLGN